METNDQPEQPMRWSIAQRMEFIEFRLVWEGRIKRADLAERFRVTVQQASADLGLYEARAPENLTYDRNAKRFVPAVSFRPHFLKPVADRQLLQLAAIGGGLVDPAETWFDTLPPIGVVPIPQRSVATTTMRWILEAIRTGTALDIEYQSLRSPDPAWRTIAPHALGHDGERWHARAWCPKNREFLDFVLSRISATGALQASNIPSEADRQWFDEVDVVLAPNPGLPEGIRQSLAKEYGMNRARLRIRTRVAWAFYMIEHLKLNLDLRPQQKHLVLVNKEEVDAACERAKASTRDALSQAGVDVKPT